MATDLGVPVVEEGKYYFISYNTEDADVVSRYLKSMVGKGLPVWYDNGVIPGDQWEEVIASKIYGCEAVIMFFSSNIFKKEKSFVKKEWKIAKNCEKKVYIVMLNEIDKSNIPARYAFWWNDVTETQSVLAYKFDVDTCADKILAAVEKDRKNKNSPNRSTSKFSSSANDNENLHLSFDGDRDKDIIKSNIHINDDFVIESGVLEEYKGSDSFVKIPDCVTSIGDSAFCNRKSIIEIVIPDSVTRIGNYAFRDCSSLINIVIPDSVTQICYGAFYGCNSIESLTLPFVPGGRGWDFTKYHSYSKLSKLISHSGLSEFFCGNNENIPRSLRMVTVTGGIIPKYAFYDCESLITLEIGEGVVEIAPDALQGCSRLIEIINKSTINITLHNNTYGTDSIKEVHKGKSKLINRNGYLFYTYDGVNYLVDYCGNECSLSLPKKYNNQDYVIHWGAFKKCSSIVNVVVSDGVTSIGDYAFSDCSSLTSINIPTGITTIEASTFSRCSSLTSIVIPDGVTNIDDHAFSGCRAITKIEIPKTVRTIGSFVFMDCDRLKTIRYLGTTAEWDRVEKNPYWNPSECKIRFSLF